MQTCQNRQTLAVCYSWFLHVKSTHRNIFVYHPFIIVALTHVWKYLMSIKFLFLTLLPTLERTRTSAYWSGTAWLLASTAVNVSGLTSSNLCLAPPHPALPSQDTNTFHQLFRPRHVSPCELQRGGGHLGWSLSKYCFLLSFLTKYWSYFLN